MMPGPRLCDMSLTLARVGDDVVLTGDLLDGIDDMMARVRAAFRAAQYGRSSGRRWSRR